MCENSVSPETEELVVKAGRDERPLALRIERRLTVAPIVHALVLFELGEDFEMPTIVVPGEFQDSRACMHATCEKQEPRGLCRHGFI